MSVYEDMTLRELRTEKQVLSLQVTKLNRAISKRKEYLKKVRAPGCQVGLDQDEEIIRLKDELAEVTQKCCALKAVKRVREEQMQAERAQAKADIKEAKLRQEEADAANAKFIDERNAKARERRPDQPFVWFGSEFNNIRGAEKRLIVMMAREIGQARYQELKRIAYWDEKHRNNRYYTGKDTWDNRKGLF